MSTEPKTYTQEEVNALLQSEGDRRVTSAREKFETDKQEAIRLAEEAIKQKIEDEARLSAEELAKKNFDEQVKALESEKSELARQSNLLLATQKLTEAGVPKDKYEEMLNLMVTKDADGTTANVDRFINVVKTTMADVETKVRTELSNVPPPNSGNGGTEITKESFNKMGYDEKLKLKTENPELFKSFMK